MEVRILGAHTTEAGSAKATALVVDGTLALDAGGLCSTLTARDQRKLKAILVTHWHYDHVKDLPMIGMNIAYHGCLEIYGTAAVFEALSTRLLDGKLYPNFLQWPDACPAFKFIRLEEYEGISLEGFRVMALPVPHGVPSVGFNVTSPEGNSLFFTGDTAGGLSRCWEHISPHVLVTELTFPSEMDDWARRTTHLSPQLLRAELLDFRRLKGYLPRVVLIHLDLAHETTVASEVAEIARELGASITVGTEGMTITV